jgi:DNA-binding GntR family transcriptional regulator
MANRNQEAIQTATIKEEENDFLDKKKLSDYALKYIRDMIMRNEIKSGERIVETTIARRLGISQTPIREALRELEAMGFVEIQPYVGCRARTVTQKELYEAYHLRSLLESYAVSEALANIGDRTHRELKAALDAMHRAAKRHDIISYTLNDVEFHKIIVKAANNPLLYKLWRMISASQWTLLTIESSGEPITFFASMHDPILDAIKQNDTAGTQALLESHFADSLGFVSRSMARLQQADAVDESNF